MYAFLTAVVSLIALCVRLYACVNFGICWPG